MLTFWMMRILQMSLLHPASVFCIFKLLHLYLISSWLLIIEARAAPTTSWLLA